MLFNLLFKVMSIIYPVYMLYAIIKGSSWATMNSITKGAIIAIPASIIFGLLIQKIIPSFDGMIIMLIVVVSLLIITINLNFAFFRILWQDPTSMKLLLLWLATGLLRILFGTV